MKPVYAEENIRVYQNSTGAYFSKIKQKFFFNLLDMWSNVRVSQFNDTPVELSSLKEAVLLGHYFYEQQFNPSKILPLFAKDPLDMNPKAVDYILRLQKQNLTSETEAQLETRISQYRKNKI